MHDWLQGLPDPVFYALLLGVGAVAVALCTWLVAALLPIPAPELELDRGHLDDLEQLHRADR